MGSCECDVLQSQLVTLICSKIEVLLAFALSILPKRSNVCNIWMHTPMAFGPNGTFERCMSICLTKIVKKEKKKKEFLNAQIHNSGNWSLLFEIMSCFQMLVLILKYTQLYINNFLPVDKWSESTQYIYIYIYIYIYYIALYRHCDNYIICFVAHILIWFLCWAYFCFLLTYWNASFGICFWSCLLVALFGTDAWLYPTLVYRGCQFSLFDDAKLIYSRF